MHTVLQGTGLPQRGLRWKCRYQHTVDMTLACRGKEMLGAMAGRALFFSILAIIGLLGGSGEGRGREERGKEGREGREEGERSEGRGGGSEGRGKGEGGEGEGKGLEVKQSSWCFSHREVWLIFP